MKIETVCSGGEFVELRVMRDPTLGVHGYFYLHEVKCSGHKVALLPFRRMGATVTGVLLRHEVTPCWGMQKRISSITGSLDPSHVGDVLTCALEELREESGYVVERGELIGLDTCFCNKMTDSKFYLFAVDVGRMIPGVAEGDGSELEKQAHNEWHNTPDDAVDPLVHILWYRLMRYLFQ